MTDIKHITEASDASHAMRAEYSTPVLKEFGPIGALTQAGSIGMNEMGPSGGVGMMQMDNMQRT